MNVYYQEVVDVMTRYQPLASLNGISQILSEIALASEKDPAAILTIPEDRLQEGGQVLAINTEALDKIGDLVTPRPMINVQRRLLAILKFNEIL